MAHLHGTLACALLLAISPLFSCSAGNDEGTPDAPIAEPGKDARADRGPDGTPVGDVAGESTLPDAAQEPDVGPDPPDARDGSLDRADADAIAPPDDADVVVLDAADVSLPDSADGEAGAMCLCARNVSLDCFFDPKGPFSMGPRPSTDIGLAQQICDGTFTPPACADNVELFFYDDCGRTEVRVTGCYGGTSYFFDTTTHDLVGASSGGDTGIACPDGGWITGNLTGGETIPSTCNPSHCNLACRRIGGSQFPTCVTPDGGGDAPDGSDAADDTVVDAIDK